MNKKDVFKPLPREPKEYNCEICGVRFTGRFAKGQLRMCHQCKVDVLIMAY